MSGSDSLLYHVQDGHGEPLLLLNGIAMSVSSWEPVVALLKTRFTVIRCDFRGQLRSPGPVSSNVDSHVEDVDRLLDSLVDGPVHVAGTSFGGLVAMYLAARRSDDIRSLTVIASADRFDSAMTVEVRCWRQAVKQVVASGDHGYLLDVMGPTVYSSRYRETHSTLLTARRNQMQGVPIRWFQDLDRLMESTEGIDLSWEIPRIECPSRIVASEKDGFIPLERTKAISDLIPGSAFQIIPEAGHAVVVENPEAVAAEILKAAGTVTEV
ncbi:MAG: alpha/beta fold hydrolase [Acidobacteria bacterium]|nr:alpha/beta fold hydrolase [Acidobacteriota bacterium]